ncbi:bifunctional UDP-N-acetylglucosamine diphosphorylase/glucosamine-1-phosphate N-acetyltransferase GlmU [Anaerococcus porci]|uniref:bifunctional UDP-N-acetylglucosamine diphosphorylase/glucosamine-1-phosphate N-acetyltransferase GlmU n=1 Tax=Anaerococcus porci TaxID=2652269 RepID=UPI002A752339|nr:bifunctional UDP-N-acetylglucosamine diphosphorylase/glucosamine-1-phosphate N-acetyltransferase GlmU [Anaerococcus porci]MDY3007330.1 bifunctional UDP-N-acetylglucosamine diphosphorylase/glucosamine-1-phosphate N-acetyltransferase GlmU [Anaerococcus porci]
MLKNIILAAGEGTRMKSNTSKVMTKILNREIISYIIDACDIENSKTILIAGKNKALIEEKFPNLEIREQKIGEDYPYGTAYAVSMALDLLEDEDDIIILNGDIPLITKNSLNSFYNFHKENNNNLSVMSTEIDNPTGYGRIIRENGKFKKIVEQKDANKDELKVKEINVGIYAFKAIDLKESLKKINTDNKSNEYYLTDCIEILNNENKKVESYVASNPDQFYGINNKKELAEAGSILRKRINEYHMLNGVIIENPDIVTIEKDVKIGKDTLISGPCKILGKTSIGESCIIEGSSRIEDSEIKDKVKIDNSVIEKSFVDEGTDIGPFSHLRPKSKLGKNVHIGNFVEVKNSNIDDGTKAGHLAYIGDADLGKNINVGCGVIFVNYDGKFKHRSIIEDDAFIGSNSNLVAPVHIEKEGYIAAGSTITKNVEEGNLSVERAKQVNIPGYVEKKKKRDLKKLKEQN